MPSLHGPSPEAQHLAPQAVEQVLKAFEQAWQRGEQPVIDAYLEQGPTARTHLLVELVHADLEYHYRHNEPVRVEAYLERYPTLRTERSVVLGLLEAEYTLRRQRQPGLSLDEYLQRFPDYATELVECLKTIWPPRRAVVEPGATWRGGRKLETAAQPPPPERAQEQELPAIPGYELLSELGRGGMGIVYQARQEGLNRLVALKMIAPEVPLDQELRERFQLEAEAVARLRHPNIVQIHEIGYHRARPYLSLEYVDGGSLAQQLTGQPLSAGDAAALVETLASAVDAAHRANVVHRDLKPSNILLQRKAQRAPPLLDFQLVDHEPKVSDFGLVKFLDSDLRQTQTGMAIGTPAYMSPEQATGRGDIGPASDIWALGAILYELLTGRPPFQASSALDLLQLVRSAEPVPPSRLQPRLPRDLDNITLKCLEKEPGKRYASAAALADDLRCFQQGKPVQARAVGRMQRLVRWARRNPLLAGTGTLALAALLAVAVVAVLFGLAKSENLTRLERLNGNLERALTETKNKQREAELATRAANANEQKARRESALFALERGQRLCEQGEVGPGLVWLARGLRAAPATEERLQYVLRMNLAGWQREWHSLHMVCGGPDAPVEAVAFSPDGQSLLTICAGRTLRIWDIATGQQRSPAITHTGGIRAASFSPDGQKILACVADRSVGLWDVPTGQLLGEPLPHPDVVLNAIFSHDGKLILSACGDGKSRLWDAATGQLRAMTRQHDTSAGRLAFSPDGTLFATGGVYKIARVWATATGQQVSECHAASWIVALCFDDSSQTLLTGESHGYVKRWDARTGKMAHRVLHAKHREAANAMVFGPAGTTVLTASPDRTVRLWDLSSDEPVGAPIQHQASLRGTAGAISPDGKLLATACLDNLGRVWRRAPGPPVLRELHHPLQLQSGCLSPDDAHILTCDEKNEVVLWNSVTGQKTMAPARCIARGAPLGKRFPCFSPDGRFVLLRTEENTAQLWELATGKLLPYPFGHEGALNAVSFSQDSRLLATAHEYKGVKVWETATGASVAQLPADSIVHHLAVNPAGTYLLTGGMRTAQLWDLRQDKRAGPELPHEQQVNFVAFCPDGTTILTMCNGRTLSLWDLHSSRLRSTIVPHQGAITALAFSPDGKRLLTCSTDTRARLWDVGTGVPLGAPLQEAVGLHDVAFHPQEPLVVLASGAPRLWDTVLGKSLGAPLTPSDVEVERSNGRGNYIAHVAFSRDGQKLLAIEVGRKRATLLQVLGPIAGDAQTLSQGVEAATGLRLDSTGAITWLAAAEHRSLLAAARQP